MLKPIERTTPTTNPNINSGHWIIRMCECRLIDDNKCTALVQDVNSGRDRAYVLRVYRNSAFSAKVCCNSKTVLKK